MEVRVIGSLTSGQQFYGTDTIKPTANYLKHLGSLAVRWLQTGYGKPDWCEGTGTNRDSFVNLLDFAGIDGGCLEAVGQRIKTSSKAYKTKQD
jgi:hypothetical protein